MRVIARRLVVVAFGVMLPAATIHAQTPSTDPSGHWEGTVEVPNAPLTIEMDITRDAKGTFAGTFNQPAQGITGLPLTSVTLDGRTVKLLLKAGPEPATFTGTLADDGQTIAGTMTQAAYALPFKLTRTGEAKVVMVPKSAPIAKEFEGTWNGSLDAGGRQMRLVLKMANQPGGTATGSVMSPDGSGVEIAVGMTQKDKSLTVDVPSLKASFAGTLSADGTELAGTWSQAGSSVPLVFKRALK